MSKVVTLRLLEEEYEKISAVAMIEHRPISNFITAMVLKGIEESYYLDPIEMAQINSDKRLLGKLKAGHADVKKNISLRVKRYDLDQLKIKAEKEGIPYQTLISSVIHKFITNQLVDQENIIKGLRLLKTR